MQTAERRRVSFALGAGFLVLVALALVARLGDMVAVPPASPSGQPRGGADIAERAGEDPAPSSDPSPAGSREIVRSSMAQVLVTSHLDAPLQGARLTNGWPLAGREELLGLTAADGTAEVSVPSSGTMAVFCDGFSPAATGVQVGSVSHVRLTPSVPLVVRCTDRTGLPVSGVRVRAQPLHADRWADYEPWDERVSYEAPSGDDGCVTFSVRPGQYFIEPTVKVGRCVVRSNLPPPWLPQRLASRRASLWVRSWRLS